VDRLKDLEIFMAVADRGSFVKAADALDFSTAVVSRSVRAVEEMLGMRLLQRSTRHVSLTPEGEDVLRRVRVLLDSYDELTALSQRAGQIAGEIRFSAPASFSSWLIPALSEFTARHPQARVEFVATDLPPKLVEDRLDLALCVTRTLPDSLIARRIGDLRLGIYAAPAYLARKGTPKHPHELAKHDCLVHSSNGRDATWPFHHPVTQEQIAPSVHGLLWSNNAEALMAAAVRGSGLAQVPHFVARDAVARGELQAVLAHWPTPPLGVYLAYTSRRNQHLRVRKLIDHLAQALAQMIESDDASPEEQLSTHAVRAPSAAEHDAPGTRSRVAQRA
jgi:DNA-binding transcriptional LysR family regulator